MQYSNSQRLELQCRQMKKRNIWLVMLLTLVTLGLYELYWFYQTRQEMISKGGRIPSVWQLALAYLAIPIVLLPVLFFPNVSTGVYLTLALLGVITILAIYLRWLSQYCRAVQQITAGEVSYGFCFWLALVLFVFGAYFVWPGVIQHHFNKLDSDGDRPHGLADHQPAMTPEAITDQAQPPQPPQPPVRL